MKPYHGTINVSDEDNRIIHRLHELKHHVYQFMSITDNSLELKEYAVLVESIELKLQRHWGFNVCRDYHDWYLVPKCICPKSENIDRKGTPYRVIYKNCKVHGE
jgi:hypothetical protein